MCSNDITNQQIIDFVNNTYVPNNIFGGTYPSAYPGSIIYEVVNNMIPEKCSYPYAINNPYTISGLTNNSSTNIIDFTYLIPNLFRVCFIKSNPIYIPSICPTCKLGVPPTFASAGYSIITYYIPCIISKNIIQSFLYFNVSSNIYKYTSPNIKDNLNINLLSFKLKNIVLKKRNTNYGSYSLAINIFNQIYSSDSLLVQLLNLNVAINNASFASSLSKIIKPFKIPWNYTSGCTYLSSNVIGTNINNAAIQSNNMPALQQFDLTTLYNIKFNKYFIGSSPSNTTKITKILKYNNIFTILNFASEVFEDILIQIQFFIQSKEYCPKYYMSIDNIPTLVEYYKNYYNNQVYVDNHKT